MKISKTQKSIIYGLVLGDGYLQKTGEKNARLRIEHSYKQKDYIDWLYEKLENIFAVRPAKITRIHPKTKKNYQYYRLQSNSSPVFGKIRKCFYKNNQKIIPENISNLLKYNLSLAVWYMDDGYYYRRDKSAHIYLPKLTAEDQKMLLVCLQNNFTINAKIYCRPDRKSCQLNFTGKDKNKLFDLIRPHILPLFNYKITSNPVSTDSENQRLQSLRY